MGQDLCAGRPDQPRAIKRTRDGHVDGLKKTYPAHVSFIAPAAEFTPRNVQTPEERITQMFAIKVTLNNPPDDLRPGVAANVKLDLKEKS